MKCPSHPGDVVRQRMGVEDVTSFATRIGVSRVSMSRLLNGQNGISAQMALSLADVFGTSPEEWLILQMEYDLWQAREDRREAVAIRKHLNQYTRSIVFKSQSRPGRTVRVTQFPSALTSNKRLMKSKRKSESNLFDESRN